MTKRLDGKEYREESVEPPAAWLWEVMSRELLGQGTRRDGEWQRQGTVPPHVAERGHGTMRSASTRLQTILLCGVL